MCSKDPIRDLKCSKTFSFLARLPSFPSVNAFSTISFISLSISFIIALHHIGSTQKSSFSPMSYLRGKLPKFCWTSENLYGSDFWVPFECSSVIIVHLIEIPWSIRHYYFQLHSWLFMRSWTLFNSREQKKYTGIPFLNLLKCRFCPSVRPFVTKIQIFLCVPSSS